MFTHKSLEEFDVKETVYKAKAMEIKIVIEKRSNQKFIVKQMPLIAFPSNYFVQYLNKIVYFFAIPKNKAILPVTIFFHDDINLYIGHNFDNLTLIQEKEIEKFTPTQKTQFIYTIAFALLEIPRNVYFSGLKLTNNVFIDNEGKMSIGFPIPVFHIDLEESDKYLPFFNPGPSDSTVFLFGAIVGQLLKNDADSIKFFEEFWKLDPLKFDEENDLADLVRKSMDFVKDNRPSFEQITNDMKQLHYVFPGSDKDEVIKIVKDLEDRISGMASEIPTYDVFSNQLIQECDKSHDSFLYYLAGTIYSIGFGVPQSYDKALEYFSKSSFCGAKNNLAKIYSLKHNHELSQKYLKESADEGYPVAMVNYYKSAVQKEFKPHPADIYIQKAADLGYPLGLLELSSKLRFTDPKKSFYYLKLAGMHGVATALHMLGIYVFHGYGIEDPGNPINYYKVAAYGMGYPPAINNLAIKLKDRVESVRLFRMVAKDQGAAAYNLANCLINGDGCEKDPKEAFYWMKHAAELNNINAMFDYAMMLKDGVGCEKNVEEAEKECKKASAARKAFEAKKAFFTNYSKEHGVNLCEYVI